MNCSPTIEWLLERRIGLLGYGRDGRATARALLERDPGARLTVLVERGEADTDLPLVTGPFDERLCDFDVLIRSPGVPVDHPALTAAREAGVVVVNPASIWLAERGRDLIVVGVTGSKGKSTTASLLAHLLRGQGLEVLLAGNIGVPLLDHLDTGADVAVLELSSYQLADLHGRIDLGLFTRLFPEHLDWHGGEEAYVAAKLRLAELLDGRPLLVNGRDERLVAATESVPGRVLGNRAPGVWRDGNRLMLDDAPLCPEGALPLIGRHNLDNAALALQAGIMLGHAGPELARSLPAFRSLPHRLEPVATVDGVRFINDLVNFIQKDDARLFNLFHRHFNDTVHIDQPLGHAGGTGCAGAGPRHSDRRRAGAAGGLAAGSRVGRGARPRGPADDSRQRWRHRRSLRPSGRRTDGVDRIARRARAGRGAGTGTGA